MINILQSTRFNFDILFTKVVLEIIMEKIKKINVFKNKNFSLLFAGVLVSNIAHILFHFAISLYILRIANVSYGQNQAALIQALYLALAGVVLLIFTPFGGVFADKFNKVKMMYITDYIRGITIGLVAIVILLIDQSIIILYVLFAMNIILSINSALFNPASGSLLRFIVKDEELQQASAYLQGSYNFQNIIGLVLGGIIFATLGIFWIFVINGLGYLFSAFSEMFIKYDYHEHAEKDTKLTVSEVFNDMKEGVKYLRREKAIFSIIMMALAINFFFSPIFSNALPYFIEFGLALEPSYLFDHFMSAEIWYSVLSISFSLSSIFMALRLSSQKTKDKYGKEFKIAISLAVISTSFVILIMIAFYNQLININIALIGLLVTFFMIGLTTIRFNVPMSLIIQRNVEPKQLGKVSSLLTVLSQSLIPIGSMITGVIISQLSITVFYIYTFVGLWIVLILYLKNKSSNQI